MKAFTFNMSRWLHDKIRVFIFFVIIFVIFCLINYSDHTYQSVSRKFNRFRIEDHELNKTVVELNKLMDNFKQTLSNSQNDTKGKLKIVVRVLILF